MEDLLDDVKAAQVVQGIRKGNKGLLEAFCAFESPADRARCVRAGIVDVLLQFLRECDVRTFRDVLPAGGDLPCPTVWVLALGKLVLQGNLPSPLMEETQTQVLQGIGPLARCMNEELLFRERRIWLANLLPYISLLCRLAASGSANAKRMVNHPSIPTFVFHVLSWRVTQPEIYNELPNLPLPEDSDLLELRAAGTLEKLCGFDETETFSQENVDKLEAMVCLDAKGNRQTPNETDKFRLAQFLVQVISVQPKQDPRTILFSLLLHLVATTKCVPFEVVHLKLMQMGLNHPVSAFDAFFIVKIISLLLSSLQSTDDQSQTSPPNDERFAKSIKAGLFELCLKLQYKFGQREWEGSRVIENLLACGGSVAVLRYSSKAIVKNEEAIKKLADSYISSDCTRKEAKLVRDVVAKAKQANFKTPKDDRVALCEWCQTMVMARQIKHCSKCQKAVYCSRECQVKDWREGGHKADCDFLSRPTDQRGLSCKNIRDEKRHEENIRCACQRVLSNNLIKIMIQASLRGYDILDCVISLNIFDTPVSIHVQPIDAFFEECEQSSEEIAQMKAFVERSRKGRSLIVSHYSAGGFCLQYFPAIGQPWEEIQAKTRLSLEMLPHGPDRDRLLQYTMEDGPSELSGQDT